MEVTVERAGRDDTVVVIGEGWTVGTVRERIVAALQLDPRVTWVLCDPGGGRLRHECAPWDVTLGRVVVQPSWADVVRSRLLHAGYVPPYNAASLGHALAAGHADHVRWLADSGLVSAQVFEDALCGACDAGEETSVAMLLAAGVPASLRSGPKGGTALMRAAAQGHSCVCALLLLHGADVEGRGNDGTTPLMCAAVGGHTRVCALLLHHGASVAAQNTFRNTALILAALNGHEDVCGHLMQSGADVNAEDGFGNTALLLAAWKGHQGVCRRLLDGGAKAHARDSGGNTPLVLAARQGHHGVCHTLRSEVACS